MTKLLKYIVIAIVLNSFISCDTYKTFYGTTYSEVENLPKQPIYRLDLSKQDLTETPEELSELVELRMLNLSGNTNLDLEKTFNSIKNPEVLEVLILDSLQLKSPPQSIQRFSKLKQLSLINNPNLNLEKTFSELEYLPLEFLNLKKNNITSLPKNITKLKTLKDLNLSYNSLKDGVSYIYLGQLPKLYSVWLDHNNLEDLPESIAELSQIRYLYLDANSLSSLPESIKKLERLFVLHLGYNNFKELPKIFSEMDTVLLLHINNNQISKIPRSFQKKDYALLGLILDQNPLPEAEIDFARKAFGGFFILSFEQEMD